MAVLFFPRVGIGPLLRSSIDLHKSVQGTPTEVVEVQKAREMHGGIGVEAL